MKRTLIAAATMLLAALAVAFGAFAGNGTPVNAGSANRLTLAVLGDVPYTGAQLVAFPAWVDAINHDPKVDLAVHLGDIKSGSTSCGDDYFGAIAALFAGFKDPLVYTPGDNEWTDCHRPSNGGYDPLERLAKLREQFFSTPGETLGGRKKQVLAQVGYPENVSWLQSRVVFAALHVVGSNNSLAPWTGNASPTPAQLTEATNRIAAAEAWVDEAFDRAEASEAAGAVLMMQADTFQGTNETLAGFASILARIEACAAAFARPVLLLQGDSHSYLVDTPLGGAPNVTRIVVQGAETASEWLRLTVDPRATSVFTWERVAF